jgi:photosystem II stability/assembly factor-like uncharacterized protein
MAAKGACMRNTGILIGLIWCLSLSASYAYQNFHGCALAPDNATGWVVTLDSMIILKTIDGGAHWLEQSNPGARRFFDITCADEMHAWTCGILGELLATSDGGNTWIFVDQGGTKYLTRIEFIDTLYGWSSGGNGTAKRSTDGGLLWEWVYTAYFNAEYYGVWFINYLEGWMVAGWPDTSAIGQGMIVHSTDGGIIWDSLFQCSNYDDYFDITQNGIIAGGNEQNYTALVLRSTNGGVSWNQVTVPGNAFYLRALDFVGGYGWAVGRFGTIIHSHDYGQTWAFQTSPATSTLFDVDFSDTLHGIACGTGIILYTYDGGETWHDGTGVEELDKWEVGSEKLEVYPNPSNGNLTIKYKIPNARYVGQAETSKPEGLPYIKIYDASGRLVRQWDNETMRQSGKVIWSGTDDAGRSVPAGVYFIKLTDCDKTVTAKVIMQR